MNEDSSGDAHTRSSVEQIAGEKLQFLGEAGLVLHDAQRAGCRSGGRPSREGG